MKSVPKGRVTLFIPGLFADPGASRDEHGIPRVRPGNGVLSRLLARANRRSNAHLGYEHRLFSLFGINTDASTDLPTAAVTRIADMGVVDREWWVRADPVHLVPSGDGLVLRAGLGLSQGESDRLVAEINQALGSDGWLLKAPSPERWYLKPPRAVSISTTPLASVVGHDIHPYLPQGNDSRVWHTRLNEIQILLHTALANAEREKRGAPTANSVWFWGGGALPAPGKCDWSRVVADDPLARGLARLSSVSVTNTVAAAKTLLPGKAKDNALIVLEGLREARWRGDSDGWAEQLARVEQEWVEPLKSAVERGELAELTIISDDGAEYHYRRTHRLRFWRLSRALTAYRAA